MLSKVLTESLLILISIVKSLMKKLQYKITSEGKQEVMMGGRSRHVLGYLQDFLFPPARARTPVKALSGGEKNRYYLQSYF